MLIFGSILTVVSIKNIITDKFSEVLVIQESNQKLSWNKIRSFKENGKRGIQITELSSINTQTGDSIFYIKQIFIFADDKISSLKKPSQISFFIDSPIIHIRETDTPQAEPEIPEGTEGFSFQDMPSMYVRNLSIVNHSNDTLPKRIQGIYIKAVQHDKAWQMHVRYKENKYDFLVSAQLRGNSSNFKIDSASLAIQGIRICNFEYAHTHYKRADDNFELHIFNQLKAQEINPFRNFTDSSYLNYEYQISSQNGLKSISGYCNAQMHIPDSLNLDFSHNTQQNQTLKQSKANLDLTTYAGAIQWNYALHQKGKNFVFKQRFMSDLKTELKIGNSALSVKSNGDFFSQSDQNNKILSSGSFDNQIATVYDDKDYKLNIIGNGNHTVINLLSNALNLDTEIIFRNIYETIWFNNGIRMDGVVHFTRLELPEGKQSPKSNRMLKRETSEFSMSENLKKANIRLSVNIDTLIIDESIVSFNNTIQSQYQNEILNLSSSINLTGQYSGSLKSKMDFSDGLLNGSLFSDGLQINNAKSLPLISSNIDFANDTAIIYAFNIPFQSKEDKIIVQKSILRSDEFLLLLSGTMTAEHQNLELGLSAPAEKFKGAAAFIINTKSTGKETGLQTLILKVDRNQGKLKIKTEVLEN